MIRNFIKYLTVKPKALFLIDSLGAMLTAFLLFVVVRYFNEYFGMPKTVLTYLSAIAACFFIYSMACFYFLKGNRTRFIIVIGIANLLYCILTILLLIVYYPTLTTVGIAYFLIEIAIVCGLVYIELNVAIEINKNRVDDSF